MPRAALRSLLAVVALAGASVTLAGLVRHAKRATAAGEILPPLDSVRAALVLVRANDPPSDPAPTLLLVASPGCPACEQARAELRHLVRPEDLGVRSVVLVTTDAEDVVEALGLLATPAYFLVDEADRLLAVAHGYRAPLALQRWMTEVLGGEPPSQSSGVGTAAFRRTSRNATP